jgi:hypothetical protein
METKKIKISYDANADDALDIAQEILDSLGVEYKMSGEETITIEYKVDRK